MRALTLPTLNQWRRHTIANATSTGDPNSRLSGSFSDVATPGVGGIASSLTGGWFSVYPLDGAAVYWRALDAEGLPLDPTKTWFGAIAVVERTPPGLSSDFDVSVGMLNELTKSATVDGQYTGIRYTAAARNLRNSGLVNGANNGLVEDGTGTLRIAQTFILRAGVSRFGDNPAIGLDAAGALVAADFLQGSSTGGGTTYLGVAGQVPTIFFSVHRTATTAGTEATVFDVYSFFSPQAPVLT